MSDNKEKNTNPGNNQNPFNKMRESLGGNKKPGDKKPKFTFSLYWIYAIIAIIFIAINFYGIGDSVKTLEAPKDFYQDMLLKGHVSRVVIVKRSDEAQIFIKKTR